MLCWFAMLRARKIKYSVDIPRWRSKCSICVVKSNTGWNIKIKKRKQFLTWRDPEKIYARSSQQYQKLQKQHKMLLTLSKSIIVTRNNRFVTIVTLLLITQTFLWDFFIRLFSTFFVLISFALNTPVQRLLCTKMLRHPIIILSKFQNFIWKLFRKFWKFFADLFRVFTLIKNKNFCGTDFCAWSNLKLQWNL